MTKRAKFKEAPIGSVVEISLENGSKCYARVLSKPLMAFYSFRSDSSLDVPQIIEQAIAFKIWVMNSAVTSGRWRVIGYAPLEQEHEVSPWFFKQDAISKALSIYQNGIERPASREECEGLECAAVWSAEHVESRLEDHFAGKANKWVEALKIK